MICQNCRAEVDDDLIFCTNCGARLFQPTNEEPTVIITEPRRTQSANENAPTLVLTEQPQTPPPNAKPPKSTSNLKWVALIVALVAIPASIFGIFLLQTRNRQVAVNTSRTNTPTATPTRKPSNANQNANANANANANKPNSNVNTNAPVAPKKIDVMSERIEIAAKEHYAVPFEIEDSRARFKGRVTVLQGEKVEVFVYIKSEYEAYFPDPAHKVFGFETGKSEDTDQVLVKEEYVLVFVNKTDKPLQIQGNFDFQPMDDGAN
jgi:hypothetical protein